MTHHRVKQGRIRVLLLLLLVVVVVVVVVLRRGPLVKQDAVLLVLGGR